MYKRLLTVLVVLMFLITSVGVISAADDSNGIDVKIVWNGDLSNQPDFVKVNLIKDGKIVDTVKLNESNLWKTTFHVSDDGNYQVKVEDSKDYSSDVKGNVEDGFVITNTIVKEDLLGASDDETPVENALDDENLSENSGDVLESGEPQPISAQENGTNQVVSANNTNGTSNSTDENSTDANSTDDSDDADDDNDGEKTTTTTTKTKTVTKIVKHDKKKPENTTKTKKNNTGLPIIVLILAVFVAAFIPFSRKR